MSTDVKLSRWSTILLVLAVLTLLHNLAAPLPLILGEIPLVLVRGEETWRATMPQLPTADAWIFGAVMMAPQMVWIYCVAQVGRLAQSFRRGVLFGPRVTAAFLRFGCALLLMGVMQTVQYPAVNSLFFWRGVTPWLADMPLLTLLSPDLIMAGAFFFVLGKIMQRGAELQDFDELTV